jgi:hypothetical protein
MTRKEIKFALEVEQVLNQISEPEYREMIVEALTLMSHIENLIMAEPKVPTDRPFDVDQIVQRANVLFVEHNVSFWIEENLRIVGENETCDCVVREFPLDVPRKLGDRDENSSDI